MEYKKTYINGCWVDGNSDKELKAVNPSNGEVIAVIKENNLDDVKSAVASAKNAFYVTRQWRDMSAQERADILLKIADEVEKQAEEMTLTRLVNLPWRLSKEQLSWLKKRMKDKRDAVRTLATEQYEMRFPPRIELDELEDDFEEDFDFYMDEETDIE